VRAGPVEVGDNPVRPGHRRRYRGSTPALTDLISGQVQAMFDTLSSSIEHIRAGRLRALGVTSVTCLGVQPDIPTVAEAALRYEASIRFGIGVPKSTPPEIIMRLNSEINAGLAIPRLKARLAELGGAPLARRLRQAYDQGR